MDINVLKDIKIKKEGDVLWYKMRDAKSFMRMLVYQNSDSEHCQGKKEK